MEEKGRWETWGQTWAYLDLGKGAKSPIPMKEPQPVREKVT